MSHYVAIVEEEEGEAMHNAAERLLRKLVRKRVRIPRCKSQTLPAVGIGQCRDEIGAEHLEIHRRREDLEMIAEPITLPASSTRLHPLGKGNQKRPASARFLEASMLSECMTSHLL